ncbi:hypothetical protein V8E36_005409 [Tilletia maclaganii]
MADLYSTFSLPPPPPPTWLSFYRGPDRSRLPNFLEDSDPAAAARRWMYDQIMFFEIHSLWLQVKVVTAVSGVILICVGAVIVRRLFQRSLWLVRLKQTERGPLIVPNAIMIFTCIEGCFSIVFIILINSIYVAWVVDRRPLPNLILWITQSWTPLIAGPIWSAFGIWHARPPKTSPKIRDTNPRFCGIPLPQPIISSAICLLVPVMIMLSVLGPGIKGNDARTDATAEYTRWMAKYANATTLDRDMLLEMQSIWTTDRAAFFWLAITMLIWFGWCCVVFMVYTTATIRLLLPLGSQLKDLSERIKTEQTFMGVSKAGARKHGAFDGQAVIHTESVPLPLATPRLLSLAANYVGRPMGIDYQQPCQAGVNQHWNVQVRDLQDDTPNTSFFPPVRPSAVVRPAPDNKTSEKYLRAAYIHFLFQGIMLSAGIAYFGEITIYLALTVVSYHERHLIGHPVDIAFLQAMWGVVFFLVGVFVSITFRTYEPVLVNLLQGGNNAGTTSTQGPAETMRSNGQASRTGGASRLSTSSFSDQRQHSGGTTFSPKSIFFSLTPAWTPKKPTPASRRSFSGTSHEAGPHAGAAAGSCQDLRDDKDTLAYVRPAQMSSTAGGSSSSCDLSSVELHNGGSVLGQHTDRATVPRTLPFHRSPAHSYLHTPEYEIPLSERRDSPLSRSSGEEEQLAPASVPVSTERRASLSKREPPSGTYGGRNLHPSPSLRGIHSASASASWRQGTTSPAAFWAGSSTPGSPRSRDFVPASPESQSPLFPRPSLGGVAPRETTMATTMILPSAAAAAVLSASGCPVATALRQGRSPSISQIGDFVSSLSLTPTSPTTTEGVTRTRSSVSTRGEDELCSRAGREGVRSGGSRELLQRRTTSS